jgi:hypothetical protein
LSEDATVPVPRAFLISTAELLEQLADAADPYLAQINSGDTEGVGSLMNYADQVGDDLELIAARMRRLLGQPATPRTWFADQPYSVHLYREGKVAASYLPDMGDADEVESDIPNEAEATRRADAAVASGDWARAIVGQGEDILVKVYDTKPH